MEKNFEHPSSFSAEKFERVANSILEQKVSLYHLSHSLIYFLKEKTRRGSQKSYGKIR